ncbi:MAG: glycosyl transferase [Prevotellaceae bacterium]|nr:glycosyl transferase [Candidatus Faecinaster equi]
MIPHIIHYCWFGKKEMPQLVQDCLASWHHYMPDWEYRLWNEDNFCIASAPQYVKEAYSVGKYAFVSDYVRLWALEQFGGLYMDVDFEVYKPFDKLLTFPAFAGYEGSKRKPIMMGVIASRPHGSWVREMLETYNTRCFILADGRFDMTPNTGYFSDILEAKGFILDGIEKDFGELHVFPVDYFCPGLTTGENIRSDRTYCEHKGLHSWSGNGGWKAFLFRFLSPQWKIRLIKLKRKIIG